MTSRPMRALVCLLAVVFVAPTAIIVSTAFTERRTLTFPPQGFTTQWFSQVLTDPVWTSALRHSLAVGAVAAVLAMLIGTGLAIGAARLTGPLASLFTVVAITPLVIPLVIVAIGFYVFFIKIGATGTLLGLAFAHATMGVPFTFVNVVAALRGIDPAVEEAAAISGAGPLRTLRRVTIPLVAPSAVVGGVLAFISSWDEVVVANFLSTPLFQTLPVVMFSQTRSGVTPTVAAVSTIVTVVSLLLFAASIVLPRFLRRGIRSH